MVENWTEDYKRVLIRFNSYTAQVQQESSSISNRRNLHKKHIRNKVKISYKIHTESLLLLHFEILRWEGRIQRKGEPNTLVVAMKRKVQSICQDSKNLHFVAIKLPLRTLNPSCRWSEPIWNIEVPKLAQMPLQIMSTLLPIFPLYHGGGINSFTLLNHTLCKCISPLNKAEKNKVKILN